MADVTRMLMSELRSLALKMDTVLAELRIVKSVALGGRTVLEAAVRNQRRLLEHEAQRELEAFELAFLRIVSDCSGPMLRSGKQSGPAVFYRELFSWLCEHELRHITWAQLGAYLGRDPSGLYRQARRLDEHRLDPAVDRRVTVVEKQLKQALDERKEAT